MGKFSKCVLITIICSIIPAGGAANMVSPAQAQPASRLFQETGYKLKGRFLQYWEQNGGLPQQGFPISEEMQERSETDGKTYTVQYMERAIFEFHLENRPPYDVLLSLVGVFEYGTKYPKGVPDQHPNKDPGTVLFPETGKSIVGKDLASGKEYVISSADVSSSRYPAIAGKTVVWSEFDNTGTRLVMKDLDGGSSKELVNLTGEERASLIDQQIIDEFIVWTELQYNSRWDPQSKPTFIKAYNRRTGETRNVHEYIANASGGNQVEYSLNGHRLTLASEGFNESPRVLDLLTRQILSVEWGGLRGQGRMYLPTLKGDILVWVIGGGGDEGWDIWGVNLQGGKPVPLVIGPGNQVAPVIAGNMLAWLDDGDSIVYQTGTGIMPLSVAFATAPDRLRELERILPPTHTPAPTSALPSPTLPRTPLHTPTP